MKTTGPVQCADLPPWLSELSGNRVPFSELRKSEIPPSAASGRNPHLAWSPSKEK